MDGSSSQVASTIYVTQVATASSSSTAAAAAKSTSKSFFDSTGKVAGTFTAVGVVLVGAIAALLYCCCFGAARHGDNYSDEENRYSSDELSIGNEKSAAPRMFGAHSKSSLTVLNAVLNRNNLSKSILSLFNPVAGGAGGAGVGRSLSKKRLNPKNDVDHGGPIMFPILEFDTRLDPTTMFENNQSKVSLADENDYSRRILHITNPE